MIASLVLFCLLTELVVHLGKAEALSDPKKPSPRMCSSVLGSMGGTILIPRIHGKERTSSKLCNAQQWVVWDRHAHTARRLDLR